MITRGEVVMTFGDKIGVTLMDLVKSIYNKRNEGAASVNHAGHRGFTLLRWKIDP